MWVKNKIEDEWYVNKYINKIENHLGLKKNRAKFWGLIMKNLSFCVNIYKSVEFYNHRIAEENSRILNL